MEERRSARAPLLAVKAPLDEDTAVESEIKAKLSKIHARREGFKKSRDFTLGVVIARKKITGRSFLAIPDSKITRPLTRP